MTSAFSASALPPAHPLRQSLNDEVHSRPTEALWRQERVFHVAMTGTPVLLSAWPEHLKELVAGFQANTPVDINWQAPQLSLMLTDGDAALRARFERHNEFVSFSLFERADHATPFDASAARRLPDGWLARSPGELLVAIDLFEWDCPQPQQPEDVAQCFERHTLVGGFIASGAGQVFTDFEINAGTGASRILVCNQSMGSRQAGRMVQRILEIETYRMMALLSFPVAKSSIPLLAQSETALVRLTNDMAQRTNEQQLQQAQPDALALDAALLTQLTELAARVEDLSAATRVRFTAAAAYHDLVDKRIAELREVRLDGVQTWTEFMERRLGPAIRTCAWTARRQSELSERIARITQLLRTRVEIEREAQNQRLLASMDERARTQLRLQETVEGLSVVAITYYGVGLVGYLAKSLKVLGLPLNPDYAVAVSIPLIGVATWRAVRAIRRHLTKGQSAN
jgi:uncharacterized membrane-anchored protein